MRKIVAYLAGIALALPITICDRMQEHRAELFVFGTMVEVLVRDVDSGTASAAFADLQQRFQAMHRDWHAWEPGRLSAINQAFADGSQIAVPDDIRDLIELSQKMESASQGRFNAAAGALIRLWGFHTSTFPVTSPPPLQEELERLLATRPSANDIYFDGEFAFSNNPAVQLDFGGIAKGYAVDIAIEILAQHGISSALVNAGGDIRALGGSEQRPWGIGIRRPVGGFYGGIKITGSESVFTSGVDQRYLEHGENRYPHIIDPRTGQATRGISLVTVITSDGYYADAAATSLVVAGAGSWKQLAQDLGLDTVMVVDEKGTVFMTPKMHQRLETRDGTRLEEALVVRGL